jgi:hypothetical protein
MAVLQYVEGTMYGLAKKDDRKRDRHRTEPIQLRIHEVMLRELDKLVQRNYSNRTEEIRNAIRRYLEVNNLWPPSE